MDKPRSLSTTNLWPELRAETVEAARREPILNELLNDFVLDRENFGEALCWVLAAKLAETGPAGAVGFGALRDLFAACVEAEPDIATAAKKDLLAVIDRDPAAGSLRAPLLYFKGWHAIQAHRFAHHLWHAKRKDMALHLQSLSSRHFQTDIHPAARFGRGIMIDHATGIVIGETAVVEDDVSLLHAVTLGGTGKEGHDRHPKVRRGVLIGAGAKILGNIEIGEGARVGAGSVVLSDVPPHMTAVGNPAKIIGKSGCSKPGTVMDHVSGINCEEPETQSGNRHKKGAPRH